MTHTGSSTRRQIHTVYLYLRSLYPTYKVINTVSNAYSLAIPPQPVSYIQGHQHGVKCIHFTYTSVACILHTRSSTRCQMHTHYLYLRSLSPTYKVLNTVSNAYSLPIPPQPVSYVQGHQHCIKCIHFTYTSVACMLHTRSSTRCQMHTLYLYLRSLHCFSSSGCS